MKFNKDWTKEDNDILRQLLKENKTPDEIVNIIGIDKLEKNPNKKYVGKFSQFILNEIFTKPKKTIYSLFQTNSTNFKNKINYNAKFNTDSGNEYVLDLVYVEDSISPFPTRPMYNISFTIKTQCDLTNSLKYERETNKNEQYEIISRLIYIISDIDLIISNKYSNIVYIIGETINVKKINFYRDIIKNSLPNFIEIKGKSSLYLGKLAYYYYK